MKALLDAVVELVTHTPPDKARQLAEAIGKLSAKSQATSLTSWAPNPSAKTRLVKLIVAWQAHDIPALELAGIVIGASAAYHSAKAEQEIELVWTGPPSELIATRKTEQALLEVIDTAKDRLFITSFVAYDVASIIKAFERAIQRNVRVSMLLEASERDGGGISFDVIGKMKVALPSVAVFSWVEKSDRFGGGKVHAKIAVADELICFISSANLTGHAMEKNMEAGLLIRGGAAPRELQQHLEALVTTHVIVRV